MSEGASGLKWASLAPLFLSVLRIMAAFMFLLSGTMKVFGWPGGMPPGTVLTTQLTIGAWLEVVCGGLLLVGLFTRPMAFLMSGMMAVAYFQFHAANGGFWPTVNGGTGAALYCFVWLYFSAAGPGPLSIDARRAKPA